MNITDNSSSMEKLYIGMLIEDKCAIGQLTDSCIYLIANEKSEIAQHAMNLMNQFNEMCEVNEYYNTYNLEIIPDIELNNHPKIRERIDKYGENLIIQLKYYNKNGDKRFIIAKTDKDDLFNNIVQMVNAAESIAKFDVSILLKSFVDNDIDGFVELSKDVFNDERFRADYIAGLTEEMMHPSFGMASFPSMFRKKTVSEGPFTYKQRVELWNRFFDNLKKTRKKHDPQKEAELDYIIGLIEPATFRKYFQKQSQKYLEKMFDSVNPKRLAEVSQMDLVIRKFENIDKNHRNDGHYRLYMCRGEESLMVHFSRSAGFVLYLIYLLDRKKNGDNVDSLNVTQYKELFSKLYKMTYRISGDVIFTDMLKNFNSDGKLQQKGLYTVLNSIREDVGKTCERMLESAEPFILQDVKAHLAVLPKHIILPDEIMTLI